MNVVDDDFAKKFADAAAKLSAKPHYTAIAAVIWVVFTIVLLTFPAVVIAGWRWFL